MNKLQKAFKQGFQKEAENFEGPLDPLIEAIPESAAWGGGGSLIGAMTPGKSDMFAASLLGVGAPIASNYFEYISDDGE